MNAMNRMDKLLVHICCAPDALYVMSLLAESYRVSGYFYNPNIHPAEEYGLRLSETRKVADRLRFELIVESPDVDRWLALTEKFKRQPEKGIRCDVCYAVRLERTARAAAERGFDGFTTVMSLSPWKKAAVMNRMGRMFAARHSVDFLEADFKKKDGFRKSVLMSREMGLYRQNYCGCVYSLPSAKRED